jgi:hypothetical protein
MAFRLYVSDTITFPVTGKLAGKDGKPAAFSFSVQAKRLSQTALREIVDTNQRTVGELLPDVITGWDNVLDPDGNEVPFNETNLAAMLEYLGMAGHIFAAYLDCCGVKGTAKN